MRRSSMAPLAALLTLVPAPARAQEPTTPPYELGEVVVSAGEPVSEASTTLRMVTADDIRARDARTLDEAIELLPDGVPLNSTFDGQFDPTLIPVEQIAYIKLTPSTSREHRSKARLAIRLTHRGSRGPTEPRARALGRADRVRHPDHCHS
jgi:hypothetical protein